MSQATPLPRNSTYNNHQTPTNATSVVFLSIPLEQQPPERPPSSLKSSRRYGPKRDPDEDGCCQPRNVVVADTANDEEASTSNNTRDRFFVLHARRLYIITSMGLIDHVNAGIS